MPKLWTLPSTTPHVQATSTGTGNVQTIPIPPGTSAIELSARTNSGYLTLDGSTPSSANGLDVIAGGQTLAIPIGYYAHGAHTLKWASAVAGNAVLNVLFLA